MTIPTPAPPLPLAPQTQPVRRRRHVGWLVAALVLLMGALGARLLYQRFVTSLDAQIERGPFASSANLYTGALQVTKGSGIHQDEVVAQLERSGYSAGKANSIGAYRVAGPVLEIQPGPGNGLLHEPVRLEFSKDGVSGIVAQRRGQALDQIAIQPELLSNVVNRSREKRRLLQYKDLPPGLVQAVLAVEDKRFFQHLGFDPFRIAKAAYLDFRSGRKGQGASTLTMQLARNVWLEPEKTWRRKMQEMLLAARLEQKLSKEQIFEHYANEIYLGRRDTYNIHGFAEGARMYFGKDIGQISLAEAAMLAGMIQRPSYLNPFRYPDRTRERRNVVLSLMRQNGFITEQQCAKATAAPLGLANQVMDLNPAPYFLDLANDELSTKMANYKGAATVFRAYTTLDRQLQQAAEQAVSVGMKKLDQQVKHRTVKGETPAMPQVALVAMDPHTGEVKALVGGRDYNTSQLNRALAMRQPGSVFKPFVYAAAFHTMVDGSKKQITPETVVNDMPTTFKFEGQTYQPGNFHQSFHGPVTLKSAMASSMNIPAVLTAEMVGYQKVVNLVRRAGMNSAIQPTPAVALGAYEATPLEVAGAYTIFANDGRYVKPTFISRVEDFKGRPVYEHQPENREVLDPQVTYVMLDMLQEVVRTGTASAVRNSIRQPVAAKTGTSRDGWFAGFTSNLLCIVWIGYDDHRELGLEGSKSALPVWTEFMKRALAYQNYGGKFATPAGLVRVAFDPSTGKLATPYCPSRMQFFKKGSEPKTVCTSHTEPPPMPESGDPYFQPTALVTTGTGLH